MNTQQYCNEKALIPGSAFYFSLKKLNSAERNAMIAIQAFYQEIESVIFHFTDIGVAQARLNWWREEIFRIAKGKPDHPVALCLQDHKVDVEKLLAIVDGLEQNLSFLSFARFEEVVIHFMRTAGERELLFASVLKNEVFDTEVIYQAMLVVTLTHYIQHLRDYVDRDLIYFSADELNQFQVKREDFHIHKTTPAIRALLQFQAEKVERAYQQTQAHLPVSLRIRMQIARAVLKEIRHSDFMVLENFIDITPLRRWWISLSG